MNYCLIVNGEDERQVPTSLHGIFSNFDGENEGHAPSSPHGIV